MLGSPQKKPLMYGVTALSSQAKNGMEAVRRETDGVNVSVETTWRNVLESVSVSLAPRDQTQIHLSCYIMCN